MGYKPVKLVVGSVAVGSYSNSAAICLAVCHCSSVHYIQHISKTCDGSESIDSRKGVFQPCVRNAIRKDTAAQIAERVILATEPAREARPPEPGDVVAWKRKDGEWQAETYFDGWVAEGNEIVLMRAADVKRLTDGATP